jgi:hypothetical protein
MPLTGELARIDDELRRAYDGDAWHGPPLREALQGLTAAIAVRKHPQLAHSVWALVSHLAADIDVVARRITEWRAIGEPEDFLPVTDASEAAWAAALENLDRHQRTLLAAIAGLDVAKLDETVPGKTYPVAVMLHGVAQHYAYDGGQIALLKKLVG